MCTVSGVGNLGVDLKPFASIPAAELDKDVHGINSLVSWTYRNTEPLSGSLNTKPASCSFVSAAIVDGDKGLISRAKSWNDINPDDHNVGSPKRRCREQSSLKRRCSLQLPSFKSLGISTSDLVPPAQHTKPLSPQRSFATANILSAALCATAAPLTPPPEDLSTLEVDTIVNTSPSSYQPHSTSHVANIDQGSTQTSDSIPSSFSGMALPGSLNATNSSHLQRVPWITEASHKMLTALNSVASNDTIQVISQTLPSQAKDGRSRPTFEEILETLQGGLHTAPYITITHAVPQARVMEELPKTPPSTPNFRHEPSDYFGNDQTIFTHAAVVPIYHSHAQFESNLIARMTHHIAAPSSVQVAILERYIPPTKPQEIDDFFSLSGQSYLADRLSELSSSNGSLLLVYPTRAGGNVFARKYIGPVIDPYLRQFTLLKGLTFDAAALMGNMTAVDNMVDFEEMQRRIVSMCQNLSARSSGRRPPSTFNLVHSETANVILDRPTWFNWYIEQEQSRLRQNLIEYHQAGGRMPEPVGAREVTVGMVLREFIDGLQRVREPAGDAEIELGVFLITRSTA